MIASNQPLTFLRFLSGPSVHSSEPCALAAVGPEDEASKEALASALDALGAPRARRAVRAGPRSAAKGARRTTADLAGALADALAAAAGFGSARTLRTGDGLTLAIPCPRDDLARAVVDGVNTLARASVPAARRPHLAASVVHGLIHLWEAPPEAALLAAQARRRKIPITWLGPTSEWLVLGRGARGRTYCAGYFSGAGGLREVGDDKIVASRLLERAGLPTTRPVAVTSADHAARVAEEIGYPVVLKPNRGHGQIGVQLELATAADVRAAYRRAVRLAGALGGVVVLEKQRRGLHVRATLVGGRVGAVLSGVAPEARADGVRTAEALAAATFGWGEGVPDEHARGVLESVLSAQGLRPGSVPEKGRRVRLGHDSQGPTADETDRIHPTLAAALERVGRLFPLPVLGVDMLIADPRKPLDPARDVIVDLNISPRFAMHARPGAGEPRDLSGSILSALFPRGRASARVPVIAGPSGTGRELEAVARGLAKHRLHPAGFTRGVAWSGSPREPLGSGHAAVQLLAFERRAEVLVLEVDEAMATEHGLPVDQLDFLLGDRARAERGDPVMQLLIAQLLPESPESWDLEEVLLAAMAE